MISFRWSKSLDLVLTLSFSVCIEYAVLKALYVIMILGPSILHLFVRIAALIATSKYEVGYFVEFTCINTVLLLPLLNRQLLRVSKKWYSILLHSYYYYYTTSIYYNYCSYLV